MALPLQQDHGGLYMDKYAEGRSSSWLEVRRSFPLVAGFLIMLAIILPLWSVSMSAPQYPEKDLTIKIYADKMDGDIWEFNNLNQYAGVKFPESIPEFKFLPGLLAGLGVFSLVTAFAPVGIRKKLLIALSVLLLLFLAGSVVDLALKLYAVGHDLDPHAPMTGIPVFTPPIIGRNKIANFTTLSLVRSGGVSLGIAFILSVVASLKRNSTVTVTDWGRKLRSKLQED